MEGGRDGRRDGWKEGEMEGGRSEEREGGEVLKKGWSKGEKGKKMEG